MNNDTNPTKSAGAKPSLLSKPTLAKQNADPNDGWEDSRILSNSKMGPLGKNPPKKRLSPAENRAKAQAQSSGFGWKTVLAVGLVCVGSYVAYEYVLEVQHNTRVAKANANAAASAAAALAAAQAQAQAAQVAAAQPADGAPVLLAGTEPTTGQAAEIVNEPAPPPSAAPSAAPTAAPLTTALESGVKPPPDTQQKALQPGAQAGTAAATPASTQAAAQPKEKTAAEKAADARNAKAKPLGAPAKAPASATAIASSTATAPVIPPAVAAEKDVSLLAALVTHNSLNAPKPSTPSAATAPSAAAPSDAAQRVPEESADSLLKRCAALEPDRQSACRAKACTGTRATEPACKTITAASIAPVAPAPAPVPAAAATAAPAAPTPAPAAQPAPTLPTAPALPTLPALPAIPLLAPAQ